MIWALLNIIVLAQAHKILMVGSLQKDDHKYSMQVAQKLVRNKDTDNEVYVLVNEISDKEKFQITKKEDRLYHIQISRLDSKIENDLKKKRSARLARFGWNPKLTE